MQHYRVENAESAQDFILVEDKTRPRQEFVRLI